MSMAQTRSMFDYELIKALRVLKEDAEWAWQRANEGYDMADPLADLGKSWKALERYIIEQDVTR